MKPPQYSLKTLLLAMAVCAFPALIAARAYQGVDWAKGMLIGAVGVVAGLVVAFAMYAALYAVTYGLFLLFVGRPRALEIVSVEELEHLPPSKPPVASE